MIKMNRMISAVILLGVSTPSFAQSSIDSGRDYVDFSLGSNQPGESETTLSVGFDYAEGKYGEDEVSRTLSIPVAIKHERGPLTLRLNIPWVTATGTRAADSDVTTLTRQTESGLGEIVLSGAYTAYTNKASTFGIDLGGKVKFAAGNRTRTLLTSGKNDYSLQSDAFASFSPVTVFASLGWTLKGDPDFVNYRDPWYSGLGMSLKLSPAAALGVSYDYRQRLTRRGDPVSEATLFLTYKSASGGRLQTYVVNGFSDASPDFGVGAVASISF